MQFSIGRGKYGPVENLITCDWDEFVDFLGDCRHLAADPCAKLDHWWVANFVLKSDATQRRIEDVDHHSGWFGVDVDRDNLSVNDLRAKLADRRWLAYTTASSVPGDSRWRIMIALDRAYAVEEHARLWAWWASLLPLDKPTKNVNRILFLPADWDGGDNLWWMQDGHCADVDSILAMIPEPEPIIMPTDVALKPAPNGQPIISDRMIAQATAAPAGGRLFRLLAGAAKKFRLQGWTLEVTDLANAALLAANQFSPGKPRTHVDREAARAIEWAARNFAPLTPMQKMRDRVLWEDRRFGL